MHLFVMSDFLCFITDDQKNLQMIGMRVALCIFGFGFGAFPCATALVKGLDCVSVLLEPPRGGSPVPLPRPAGDPQTHWPILMPHILQHSSSSCQPLWLDIKKEKKNTCEKWKRPLWYILIVFSVNNWVLSVQFINYTTVIFDNIQIV